MRQEVVTILCSECGCNHLARVESNASLTHAEQLLLCPLTGGVVKVLSEHPVDFVRSRVRGAHQRYAIQTGSCVSSSL